jgi:mediator of RNA polymerase II transcription subunit 17, fungi type
MAHLAVHDSDETPLLFPRHAPTRLRVSLATTDAAGQQRIAHDTWHPSDQSDLDSLLRVARDEVIDQEIFALLIKEAAMLLTATVNVSERLIVIEASQNSELRFELVSLPVVFRQCSNRVLGRERSAPRVPIRKYRIP